MSHERQHSCLYQGWVRHRRFVPKSHQFTYPLFMLYLDLDELEELLASRWFCSIERFNLVSFRRQDYFAGTSDASDQSLAGLKRAVINAVFDDAQVNRLTKPNIQRVAMLTHLRYFNRVFNPVTFYYCYDESDQLVAIVAEITNTPWDERHHYVMHWGQSHAAMTCDQSRLTTFQFSFNKAFHVSPFNPMAMKYKWFFSPPEQGCAVHMENRMLSEEAGTEKHFDATVNMKRKPISALGRTLIRFPNMCVSVVVGIYWQAFKLWIKRMPLYDHPSSEEPIRGKKGLSP